MSEKEIRFSENTELKLEVLANHDVEINSDFVIEVVRSLEKLEQENDKFIAQRRLTDELALRVVYREFNAFIVIITLCPGKRSRYEKD